MPKIVRWEIFSAVNALNLFLFLFEAPGKQAIVFETGKSFQPGLIFASEAGAYVSAVSFKYFLSKKWSSLWDYILRVVSSLACKY